MLFAPAGSTWEIINLCLFIPAPLKWVVGSVEKSEGKALGRKNTASDTRKISGLGLCVGIFFRVADYGIGYFT
jgi:hypothetical protein